MRAKQIQIKHWQNCGRSCPHKTTLEVFWSRAGIKNVEDETALRTFRLEIECNKKGLFERLTRTYKPDYSLAA